MTRFKEVSRKEFFEFTSSYPGRLVRDVVRTYEPPQVQFNDFSLGDWPASVVATYEPWGHTPGDIYGEDPGAWRILESVNAS